jgi:DNA gyrase subunit B
VTDNRRNSLSAENATANNTLNEFEAKSATFLHKGGISEMVDAMSAGNVPVHSDMSCILVEGARDNVTVQVALKWCDGQYQENTVGFVNCIRTNDGGTHLEGARSAISKTLNAFFRKVKYD